MKVVIMESLSISAAELAELKKPFEEKGAVFEEYEKNRQRSADPQSGRC